MQFSSMCADPVTMWLTSTVNINILFNDEHIMKGYLINANLVSKGCRVTYIGNRIFKWKMTLFTPC